jgi:hypothetical protein
MSENDKSIVEDYCNRMDKKYNRLMNVIYGLMIAIVGAGAVQFITFGEVKSQVKTSAKQIDFIGKDYIPTMFLEGFAKNQNYQTEEIVATIKGDHEKIKEINEKYIDFQKTMINSLIQMRGGISNVTRSAKK